MLGLKTMCIIVDRSTGTAPISRRQPNAKVAYSELRRSIRRLKRNCPKHMDVAWFEESLGLTKWNDRPVRRYFDKSRKTILSTTIIAPAQKLP